MDINLEYIKALASSHEGVDVEFKETTVQLNRGMESLCGMVNGKGGIVIFQFLCLSLLLRPSSSNHKVLLHTIVC